MSEGLADTVSEYKPVFDACLDAICVVDRLNRVVYVNASMRELLGVKAKEAAKLLKDAPCFCDLVKLAVCKPSCQLQDVLDGAESVRFDETPASRGGVRLRLNIQVSPLRSSAKTKKAAPVGALISARDVTSDFLVQAKYLKALQLLEQRDSKIAELEDKLASARSRPA